MDSGNVVEQQSNPVVYVRKSTNGFAIASMVLGIVWLYWVGSILALVFGYKACKEIDVSGGAQDGRGMATAGIVLGWIGVGTASFFLLVFMWGAILGGSAGGY